MPPTNQVSTSTPPSSWTIQPSHPMITYFKNHIVKPNPKYCLHNLLITKNSKPTSFTQDKKIHQMMPSFDALVCNKSWSLVPPHLLQNIIGCKWIYKIKHNLNSSITRYRACLIAKGFHQCLNIDFYDTFSHVVKPTTIWTIRIIVVNQNWVIRQLNVNNAFFLENLTDDVYIQQDQGFINAQRPTHVWKIYKAPYSHCQAPRP